MIIKKTYKSSATHLETGLTFKIYCVDCFVESFVAIRGESLPEYIFENRYYETEGGQLAIETNKTSNGKPIWIVKTEVNNWYVVEE